MKSTKASKENELKRDSIKNINSWKKRLTQKEVHNILIKTQSIGMKLYPEIYEMKSYSK